MNMKNKLKLVTLMMVMTIGMALCTGCQGSNNDYDESELEYLEGYEGLSDEETNQKLIEEADKMEVVPDKKQ